MKSASLFVPLLALLLSSCSAALPTPTPVPLPPRQHVENAYQWLQAHAMLSGNADWAALQVVRDKTIAGARSAADTIPAICAALRELHDGNAWLLVPGMEIPNFYNGYRTLYPQNQTIIDIDPGSPADKAGLQVGDLIEQDNGSPPVAYDKAELPPPCNQKPLDTNPVEHLVIRRAAQTLQITVHKTSIASDAQLEYPPSGRRLGTLAGGLGYIELTFEDGTHHFWASEFQKLMRTADQPPVCGWIIDLRRNQGGDFWSYIAAAGPILGEGELGGFEYSDGTREAWAYRNGQVFWNQEARDESWIDGSIYRPKRTSPVALLISPATQAAAELLLVAFRGRPDVRSFGEPTRGLPTLVTHTELSDGSSIFVSGANSFDRTRKVYGKSLEPDVPVATDWSNFGTDKDPVVLTAAQWLQSQSSCK